MGRINVTESFLPPYEEYEAYLKKIWGSHYLTNQGPLSAELEDKLKDYLSVSNLHFMTNGTIALQVALQALGLTEGEVITTPFSYVATTSAILWQRLEPVFVDIEEETFCIDADKIEAAITPKTRAILAVHVFGYPCDIEKIEAIAKKNDLKVIYDGAHAFGAKYKGRSLLDYGDITMCSFHATKLFHTIEGGCLVVKDKDISEKVELIKRFGHNGDDHFMLGINAKASEFQAAMGLSVLPHVEELINKRMTVSSWYDELLDSNYKHPAPNPKNHNYAYYPIIFKNESELLKIFKEMNEEDIFPRRYFYPSLNNLPYLSTNKNCPVAEDVSSKIACLPLYPSLEKPIVKKISNIIEST